MIDLVQVVNSVNIVVYPWLGGTAINGRQKKYYKYSHVTSLGRYFIIYGQQENTVLVIVHYLQTRHYLRILDCHTIPSKWNFKKHCPVQLYCLARKHYCKICVTCALASYLWYETHLTVLYVL